MRTGAQLRGAPLLFTALLGACSGGQTGDEIRKMGPNCVEIARRPIGLDEMSALGFTPAQALESVALPRTAPMRWAPQDTGVSFRPETGDGSITLSVTPDGTFEWVESEQSDLTGRSSAICPDLIEAPASVHLATAGGALDETFDTVLDLDSPSSIEILYRLDGTALDGNLTFSAQTLGYGKPSIDVSALLTRYGTAGTLDVRFLNGNNGLGTGLASWPIDNPCDMGTRKLFPVTLDTRATSSSIATGADALALAQSTKSVQLTWPDGKQVAATLDIQPKATSVCAHLDPAGGFDLWATLTLRTADGAMNQHYGVNVSVDSADATSVHLTLNDPCNMQRMAPTDFVQACGDWGVALAGYNDAHMQLDASVDATSALSGTITIVGDTPSSCPEGQKCDPYVEADIAKVTLTSAGP